MPRAKALYQANTGALVDEARALNDLELGRLRAICNDDAFINEVRGRVELLGHLVSLHRDDSSRPATPREVQLSIERIQAACASLIEGLDQADNGARALIDRHLWNSTTRVDEAAEIEQLLELLKSALDSARHEAESLEESPGDYIGCLAATMTREVFKKYGISFTTTEGGPAILCTSILLDAASASRSESAIRGYVRKIHGGEF